MIHLDKISAERDHSSARHKDVLGTGGKEVFVEWEYDLVFESCGVGMCQMRRHGG